MSKVRFIIGVEAIKPEEYLEEYSLYPAVSSDYSGNDLRFIVRLKKAFKRRRNRRNQSPHIVEIRGLMAFCIDVVKPAGLRLSFIKKGKISTNYSFCIDERIYYRRLISKPALGPSPPEFLL
jgi:hypothetical protein